MVGSRQKSPWRFSRIGLQQRIFLVVLAVSVISTVAETFFIQRFFQSYVVDTSAAKAMSVAQQASRDPELVAGFFAPEPIRVIQPIAERYRLISGTSYVVVFNMETIRYSHPLQDRLGKLFVGGDEQDALQGKTYVSQALGTLGLSIRAFVPIRDINERQIGVVSVGLLVQDLDQESRRIGAILFSAALLSLALGLVAAILLSRNIKKTIFGLEPYEIATVLEERNVIISSIKEGIIAIDQDERIILINENAARILDLQVSAEGKRITELLPDTKLPELIRTGIPQIDEEQVLNRKVVLVNRIPLCSNGKIIGAVATFRDLSEVRSLAEELTEVRLYIDALRAQHHEYLNRMHVVSGLLQLGKYEEAVRFIVKTVRSQQLLFDLLRTRVMEPDIAALILVKINEAQESNIEVVMGETAVFPALRPEVVSSVVTILGNLLQNAIEALRTCGTHEKRIVLDCGVEAGFLTLRVQDNGDGLAAALREHIFERGVTSKSNRTNMGIGLSLVKMHAERLGGTVALTENGGVLAEVRLDFSLLSAEERN